MLHQAFIAVLAERKNLTLTDIVELSDWIQDHVDHIDELFDPSDYTETFESFQRQESNEAIAQDFLNGNAVGFSEVSYDPQTGCETPVDNGEWS